MSIEEINKRIDELEGIKFDIRMADRLTQDDYCAIDDINKELKELRAKRKELESQNV